MLIHCSLLIIPTCVCVRVCVCARAYMYKPTRPCFPPPQTSAPFELCAQRENLVRGRSRVLPPLSPGNTPRGEWACYSLVRRPSLSPAQINYKSQRCAPAINRFQRIALSPFVARKKSHRRDGKRDEFNREGESWKRNQLLNFCSSTFPLSCHESIFARGREIRNELHKRARRFTSEAERGSFENNIGLSPVRDFFGSYAYWRFIMKEGAEG